MADFVFLPHCKRALNINAVVSVTFRAEEGKVVGTIGMENASLDLEASDMAAFMHGANLGTHEIHRSFGLKN